ncbi:MAG: response regulator [Vampirovibrionales bacterium]
MKILVVDDIQFTCTSLKKMLERDNHRVLVAHSGAEALGLLKANPDIGLVLTDLVMEGMNGKELLQQTQKLEVFSGLGAMSPPPFVLISAALQDQNRDELDQMGFRGVLEKPLSAELLFQTIDQLTRIQTREKALNLIIVDVPGETYHWFQTMFEDTPHQLVRCESGKAVLDWHASGQPISIVVAEYDLGDMNATELYKKLKAQQYSRAEDGKAIDLLPFLLITDGLSAQQLKEIREAGVKDLLTKPLDLAMIADKLSKLSNGSDYKKPTKMADEILVVDDVGFNLVILERTFKDLGYFVQRASSAYEAIEYFKQPNRIKAVFCDLVMPGLDGVDMLRYLKTMPGKELPPFVLVTASSDEVRMGEATRIGFKHILRKPLKTTEVELVLKEILSSPTASEEATPSAASA